MEFGSIASGSSGNCLYIKTVKGTYLVDAGISCKRIVEGITGFGTYPEDIKGIFITHEHTDHINGLAVFLRKYDVKLFATEGTADEILRHGGDKGIPTHNIYIIEPDREFFVEDLTVRPFSVSHDAKNPVGYTFEQQGKKLGIATDLGVFDDYVVDALKGSDLLYVEANHDLNMLQVGPYPYHLKRRIAGTRGHLSNESSAKLIKEARGEELKHVILGHLSKENNFPDLALSSVTCDLKMLMGTEELPFSVEIAPRDHMSKLYNI